MNFRIRDFGTFKQKVGAPRTGRNPRTGEEIKISGKIKLIMIKLNF